MKKKSAFEKSDLTSRERRALNRGETISGEAASEADRRKFRVTLVVLASLLAAAMIAAGIIIPVYYNLSYMGYERPIAVFEIEVEGEVTKLEYEIFSEEYPNVSDNFIFLASKGFFDGTIIYDATNEVSDSWIKIGGYTDLDYNHRSKDPEFMKKLEGNFVKEKIEACTALKYMVKKSSSTALDCSTRNYLLTGNVVGRTGSPTEFQFSCSKENTSPFVYSGGSKRTFSSEPFAAPLSSSYEKAESLFIRIAGLTAKNGKTDDFATPLCGGKAVVLKRVRVFNYSAGWETGKYINGGFQTYMEEKGAIDSYWTHGYIKPKMKDEE